MIKKCYIILLVFCFFMLFCITDVLATEVTDRDIAIACILASGNHSDGITVAQDLGAGPDRIRNYGDRHELDDWFIVDFSNNWLANLGMTALVLEKDNNVIISFRGTDTEWIEDAINGVLNFHIQEFPANAYVKKIVEQYSKKDGNYKFYVTGYSLGGYIAQTAGATVEKEANKYPNIQLAKIMDFNGIGINFLTFLGNLGLGGHTDEIEILKKLGEEGRLVDYYIYGDIISAAGMHYGEMRSILPSIDTISEIGSKYTIFNSAEKLLPISSLIAILMENALNAFKTEIFDAARTYDVFSIMGFLDLTHGGTITEFGSLNYIEANEKPKVVVSTNNQVIPEERLNISSNITLKAETHNASVKSYNWYVSSDGQTWGEPIKEINLYDRKASESPTNTLVVNIGDFKKGETKYYKVVSYFNDKCVSSQYKYNIKKLQYEYIKNEEKSNIYNHGTTETVIKINSQTDVQAATTLLNNWMNSLSNSNINITNILGMFIDAKNIVTPSNSLASSIINTLSGNTSTDLVDVVDNLLSSVTTQKNTEPQILVDFNDIFTSTDAILNNNNHKTDILANNNYAKEYTYEGKIYKLAITEDELEGLLEKISTKGITINNAKEANQAFVQNKSDSLAKYYIDILENNIENPTLEDSIKTSVVPKTVLSGTTDNLKSCINSEKLSSVHVEGNNGQWATCVGYTNEGNAFSDYLFINPNTGTLAKGDSPEIKDFYTIREFDTIFLYD